MSFPDEYRSGYNSIHRTQESQSPFLKLESCRVPRQSEIVEAKRLPQSNLAELPVDRIGIGECQALSSNRDVDLLLGYGEGELQLDGPAQIHGFCRGLKTIPGHPHCIRTRFQIWRRKSAEFVRRKHDGLRQIRSDDLDSRPGNHCARRILDRS